MNAAARTHMARRRIYLASASPRRLDLLRGIGLTPEVRPSTVGERLRPSEPPAELVQRLAEAKARAAVAAENHLDPDGLVLGADTTVVIGDRVLGKPADDAEARAMLRTLRGRSHNVLTGVFLMRLDDGRTAGGVESSRVVFRDFDDGLIEAYVASGEPRGKAGAYAIQERGVLLTERIEGSWSNVVGLPLERLPDWIGELGIELRELIDWSAR